MTFNYLIACVLSSIPILIRHASRRHTPVLIFSSTWALLQYPHGSTSYNAPTYTSPASAPGAPVPWLAQPTSAVPVAVPVAPPGYGGASSYGNPAPHQPVPTYGVPTATPVPPYAGNYGASGGFGGDATIDVPLSGAPLSPPPTAADQPTYEPGYKDLWAFIAFWVHVLVIVIIAFALGVPAMKADGAQGDVDPGRDNLDFNAALFVRMILLGLFVSGAVSVAFFMILRKYGGALIKCSLYTSVAVQVLMACITFAFAPVAGVFLLLTAAFTVCYIYFVRNRIPFAAANLQAACDAVNAYPSLFLVAVTMLFVQSLWIFFWAAAALGIQHKLNVNAGAAASNSDHGSSSNSSGGLMMFVLLVSFYWGVLTFRGVVHFVTASVVGNWWFIGTPTMAVWGSLHRAFTANFGSIALGALVTSVLRALEAMARNAESRARRANNAGAAFAAACAACLLGLVRRAVEYFNQWAIIFVALTGAKYTQAGREAVELFRKRGWSALINDDLVGSALAIVGLMIGAVSAVLGGGVAYVFMGNAANGTVAGIVAFFCFLSGMAMASVMLGVLTSAVKTIFVCFALNPVALQATHPAHLSTLCAAWYKAHPAEFSQCGYATTYMSPVGAPM